ncbi:MAG: hypothetical protein AAF253_01400 [Pseudomonadota bacterium]
MSEIGMILDRIGRSLVADVVPHLEGHYAGGQAMLTGIMTVMAGEAWDGAADRLHREIEAMRAVLREGGVAADETAASLRLSDLEPTRNRFAERLITLQTRLETSTDPADFALNTRIWGLLLAGAAERMPTPPEFPETEPD